MTTIIIVFFSIVLNKRWDVWMIIILSVDAFDFLQLSFVNPWLLIYLARTSRDAKVKKCGSVSAVT